MIIDVRKKKQVADDAWDQAIIDELVVQGMDNLFENTPTDEEDDWESYDPVD